MRTYHTSVRATIVAMLLSPTGPLVGWQTAAAAPAQTAPAAKPRTQPAPPPDGGWPRAYTTASAARLIMYQPQVGLWPDQKHMTLVAAVSYLATGAQKPALGVLKIESDTKVSVSERLVNFSDFKITGADFPNVPKEQVSVIVGEIKDSVPRDERVIALDRVLAMVDTSLVRPNNIAGVKADAPVILFSETPAALVNFDGDPIWSPIPGNELRFAVNTNWDFFEYPPAKSYFLRVNQSWLVAQSPRGPWQRAGKLPDSFSRLPDDNNWKDVKAALPGKPIPPEIRPVVFVSTTPAELIRTTGAPKWEPVPGTKLLWLSNSESDVFRMGEGGPMFYLVSGRWFSSPSFSGPWTFATPALPEDFKNIPLEHPRSRVMASVPGTRQAVEAVMLAQIPQTGRVNRHELKAPDVAYAGAPQFEPIAQTSVARAVNTDKDIVKVGDMYFMCFQGVWFRSATPNGPWEVTDSVPKSVYEIPISSPAHNVTYVTVEDSDDDWVEFASAAAYTGMMVAWGCAMWESGWYYPPYFGGGYYYGHYPTYGYGASYNPWTGAYTMGGGMYGPYGGAGFAARYNPTTGTYSRGAAAYGPGGGVGAAQAWNPRTGTYAQTRQASNVYGSWGSTAVQRGDQWASTSRFTSRSTGTTTRATQGSGGGGAITRNQAGPGGVSGIGRTAGGDVYAGRDGNVYRNQNGSWQKYDNGGWNAVTRPEGPAGTTGRLGSEQLTRPGTLDSATRDQLNRDRTQRTDGARRSSDLSSYRSSSPSRSRSSAGSYRPSGGFSRGGGRGRR